MYHIPICNYNYQSPDYFSIDRPQGSGDYLLLFFRTPMKIVLRGKTVVTKEDAFILYHLGTPQEYQAVKSFKNSFIHFACDNPQELKKYGIPFDTVFYISNTETVSELFRQIGYEYSMKYYLYEEKLETLLMQMFIELSRQLIISDDSTIQNHDLVIQFYRARFFILTQPEQDWDIESMAALTNFGSSQFYHHYKRLFSTTPKAELIEARIEKAKGMLKTSNLTIGEIARLCGFKTPEHFTRYFKARCGCTPSEYALC